MPRRLLASALLVAVCARGNEPRAVGIDTAAFGISAQQKPQAPTPEEVAHSRGDQSPDQIDSLIAKVVGLDAEFAESDSHPHPFMFSGQNDSAFKRLAVIPAAVRRLVSCLGWNRRSRATWHGAPVLVGAVCGHVLRATPYIQTRNYPDRWPRGFRESAWADYRDPSIDNLRAVQTLWLKQVQCDPS
jgi:hypothetical protein